MVAARVEQQVFGLGSTVTEDAADGDRPVEWVGCRGQRRAAGWHARDARSTTWRSVRSTFWSWPFRVILPALSDLVGAGTVGHRPSDSTAGRRQWARPGPQRERVCTWRSRRCRRAQAAWSPLPTW